MIFSKSDEMQQQAIEVGMCRRCHRFCPFAPRNCQCLSRLMHGYLQTASEAMEKYTIEKVRTKIKTGLYSEARQLTLKRNT